MKYRTMGKLNIQASAFGLGCMRFNGAASGDSVIDEQKAISRTRNGLFHYQTWPAQFYDRKGERFIHLHIIWIQLKIRILKHRMDDTAGAGQKL